MYKDNQRLILGWGGHYDWQWVGAATIIGNDPVVDLKIIIVVV